MHKYVCSPSYLFYSKIDGLTFVSFFSRILQTPFVFTSRPFMFYMCGSADWLKWYAKRILLLYSYCILQKFRLFRISNSYTYFTNLVSLLSFGSTFVILSILFFRFEKIKTYAIYVNVAWVITDVGIDVKDENLNIIFICKTITAYGRKMRLFLLEKNEYVDV